MNLLQSPFPPLSSRAPLPNFHTPLLYSLNIIACLLPREPVSFRVLAILPVYTYLVLTRPFYTSGSPADDYNNATLYFFLPLSFLDFHLFSPREGRQPRWIGRDRADGPDVGKKRVRGEDEDEHCGGSLLARARWALYLQSSSRGVGWDWEVKNVHAHPEAGVGRWVFVRREVGRAAWFWGLRCLSVYGMAMLTAMALEGQGLGVGMRVLRGWICGCWGYQGLAQMYHLAAAATVAAGVCEPWEWPPLFGRLSDMWSVRQLWSVVWHQNLRRAVQQPGIRLSRFLGLAKGTLASKYFQLYLAFAISMLSHQWHNFIAVRADVGELRFFMSQAVAITVEDFVQWCWKRATGRTGKDPLTTFERVVGWAWTFAWFSYSIPAWSAGMLGAKVIGHDPDTAWALRMGREHAAQILLR